MTRSLEDFKKEQKKTVLTIEERIEVFICHILAVFPLLIKIFMCFPGLGEILLQDPFGDLIKKIMHVIQEHAQLQPTCELGSQKYELWVIQMERKGECTHLIVSVALPSVQQTLKTSTFL